MPRRTIETWLGFLSARMKPQGAGAGRRGVPAPAPSPVANPSWFGPAAGAESFFEAHSRTMLALLDFELAPRFLLPLWLQSGVFLCVRMLRGPFPRSAGPRASAPRGWRMEPNVSTPSCKLFLECFRLQRFCKRHREAICHSQGALARAVVGRGAEQKPNQSAEQAHAHTLSPKLALRTQCQPK